MNRVKPQTHPNDLNIFHSNVACKASVVQCELVIKSSGKNLFSQDWCQSDALRTMIGITLYVKNIRTVNHSDMITRLEPSACCTLSYFFKTM